MMATFVAVWGTATEIGIVPGSISMTERLSTEGSRFVYQKELTVQYLVQTNSKRTLVEKVLLANGLPKLGATYKADTEFNKGLRVIERRPRATTHPLYWMVDIVYSNEAPDRMPIRGFDDPLERPVEIDFMWEERRELAVGVPVQRRVGMKQTIPGKELDWQFPPVAAQFQRLNQLDKIGSSAGEPFDPPPEIQRCRWVIRCRRYEAYEHHADFFARLQKYHDTINRERFMGLPVASLRCRTSGGREFVNGRPYWRVTYEFHHDPLQWYLYHVDEGTYYWKDGQADKTRMPFLDAEGNRIIGLLDGIGQALDDDKGPVPLLWQIYTPSNFRELKLEDQLERFIAGQLPGT